jgi:hypothetical protein
MFIQASDLLVDGLGILRDLGARPSSDHQCEKPRAALPSCFIHGFQPPMRSEGKLGLLLVLRLSTASEPEASL